MAHEVTRAITNPGELSGQRRALNMGRGSAPLLRLCSKDNEEGSDSNAENALPSEKGNGGGEALFGYGPTYMYVSNSELVDVVRRARETFVHTT